MLVGLQNGLLYALIALGYTMVYGIIELINFAHGDLFMLGTLVAARLMVTVMGVGELTAASILPLLVALVVCMAFGAGVNMASSARLPAAAAAPKLAPLITAVGISFIFRWIGQQDTSTARPRRTGRSIWGGPQVEGVFVYKLFMVIAVTVPLLLLMTWIVTKTRMGKAMRAIAQDQDAARLMGINVNRTISFTFGLGGALAGAAGVLYFLCKTQTYYDPGFQLGLIAFTAAVLGGIGNLTGAVLGGLLIGLIQGLNEGGASASARMVAVGRLHDPDPADGLQPDGMFGQPSTEKV